MESHSHLRVFSGLTTVILASLCLSLWAPANAQSIISSTEPYTTSSDVAHRPVPSASGADLLRRPSSGLCSHYFKLLFSNRSSWSMVAAAAILGLCPCVWLWRRRVDDDESTDTYSDPGLLKKHSMLNSYTTSKYTYPAIRTFFREHPQGQKLPTKPTPIPLLVFVHGLGGSVAQFHPLLNSLVNVASCLSIDLPGCGLSKFSPKDWDAYTTESLVELVATAIKQHRDDAIDQKVVLIGHSMGCSIAALLASTTSPYKNLISEHVIGFIAVCPSAAPPDAQKVAKFKKLLGVPGPIFDIWRAWDRRGGTESASVRRFVGEGAEAETRKLQVRYNEQSKTPVWRRMARGALPRSEGDVARGGLPGREIWSGLQLPIFLVAGEADPITPAGEVTKILGYFGKSTPNVATAPAGEIPDSAAPVDIDSASKNTTSHHSNSAAPAISSDRKPSEASTLVTTTSDASTLTSVTPTTTPKLLLKTTILPSPASHALLYAPSTSRILAGLIQTFLSTHIDTRLSLGWQLQYLTTEGKWDVKNLAKWTSVTPVSEPIAGVFRAMKTLREVDERHSPKCFVREWKGKVRVVVDISHENPVYDPKGLEEGGIKYVKFPTVSKLPPQVDEVKAFIKLVDELRAEHTEQSGIQDTQNANHPLIGVHCHYGFNRTGFFLVSYLVERLGYRLQDAVEEFKTARPPGIRHEHFIDELSVRYCVGLRKSPTI